MAIANIGSYYCELGDRFRVMRSYITHWRLFTNNDNAPVTWNGSQFVLPSSAVPGFQMFITILPEFIIPNSNAYTLDKVITEVYYTISPSPTIHPYGAIVLRYVWDTGKNAMVLEIQSEVPDTVKYFNLSGVGGSYWLDPVPT